MQNQQYEIHPAATLFPLMTNDEFEGLKQDIAKNGQREDIVVWCGKLIDGRNRLRACEELQRTPSIAELDEDQDPWKYVISHNLHRRHLTTSQRAMVAAKLSKLKQGGDRKSEEIKVSNDTLKMDEASKQLNVGRATVARAKQVQEHGSESVKQAVEQGSLPVSLAAKLVKEVPDKKEQSKIVAKGTKEVRSAVETKPEVLEWADVNDDEPQMQSKIDDSKMSKNRRGEDTKKASRKKEPFSIELHDFISQKTGQIEGIIELLEGVPSDGWECFSKTHPELFSNFEYASTKLAKLSKHPRMQD